LQIGIAAADDGHLRHGRFALPRDLDLPADADERVFRRLIAVARRKVGGPLNVGL